MSLRLFIIILSVVVAKFFIGCSPAVDRSPVRKAKSIKSGLMTQKTAEAEEKIGAEWLISVEKRIFSQMNRYYSEAWFVITKDRFSHPKNPFEMALNHLEKVDESGECGFYRKGLDGVISLIEKKCNKNIQQPRIQYRWNSATELQVWYTFGQISELIPVGVLEFKDYKPECKITIDGEGDISEFSCKELGQAFGDKVESFLFEKLNFKKDAENLLEIVGKTINLEGDLIRYESIVPVTGTIEVMPTDLRQQEPVGKQEIKVTEVPAPVAVQPSVRTVDPKLEGSAESGVTQNPGEPEPQSEGAETLVPEKNEPSVGPSTNPVGQEGLHLKPLTPVDLSER